MQTQTRWHCAVFAASPGTSLLSSLPPPPSVFGLGEARLPARFSQEARAEQQRAADRAGVHPRHCTARHGGRKRDSGAPPVAISSLFLPAVLELLLSADLGKSESSLGIFFKLLFLFQSHAQPIFPRLPSMAWIPLP